MTSRKEAQRRKLTDILYELNLSDIVIDYKLVDLFNDSWEMAKEEGKLEALEERRATVWK